MSSMRTTEPICRLSWWQMMLTSGSPSRTRSRTAGGSEGLWDSQNDIIRGPFARDVPASGPHRMCGAFVCRPPLLGMEWMSGFTEHDPRLRSAWRTWLSALAFDAEAAIAAAFVYESLPPEGRDAWLDAVAMDIEDKRVDVPAIAVYAPLLAV